MLPATASTKLWLQIGFETPRTLRSNCQLLIACCCVLAMQVFDSSIDPHQGLVTACTTVADVQQLLHQHGSDLNFIRLAACITKLHKLPWDPEQQKQDVKLQLLQQLWQLLQPKLQECRSRELSNISGLFASYIRTV